MGSESLAAPTAVKAEAGEGAATVTWLMPKAVRITSEPRGNSAAPTVTRSIWSATANVATDAPNSVPSFGGAEIPEQEWRVDEGVLLNLPEATGGDGQLTYELRPAHPGAQLLPDGLDFTSGDRRIKGTPTREVESATWLYIVRDEDGDEAVLELTASVGVSLAVIAALEQSLALQTRYYLNSAAGVISRRSYRPAGPVLRMYG